MAVSGRHWGRLFESLHFKSRPGWHLDATLLWCGARLGRLPINEPRGRKWVERGRETPAAGQCHPPALQRPVLLADCPLAETRCPHLLMEQHEVPKPGSLSEKLSTAVHTTQTSPVSTSPCLSLLLCLISPTVVPRVDIHILRVGVGVSSLETAF